MSQGDPGDSIRWYAVHTHPNQEERANSNLIAWKVETFSPKIKKTKRSIYARTPIYLSKPLFPGYIFARFKVNTMLRNILFTRGVHSVVSFGGIPARINDEIIALLQSQTAEDGLVKSQEEFKAGDRVKIEDGPLKNLLGVFKRDIKGSDRVLILLASISYQGSVVIEQERVSKLKPSEARA